MTESQRRTDASQLAQWLTGKWVSHAIHTAAQLSIADRLADGEKSVEELAREAGAHAPSLYRLLRALASIGIFRESAPGRFAQTPTSDLLRAGEMRAACLMIHSEWHDRAWSELTHSVKTGEVAFEKAHGEPLFDWLSANPDAARLFHETMVSGKAYRDHGVAEHYDFTPLRCVVDVGGGHGSLLISILRRHEHLRGVLVDLAPAAAGARAALHEAGVADRCEVVTADFFASVPEGGDAYMLAHILHDWSDDLCRKILDCCHRAMRRDGRLLIVESIMPEDDSPDRLKWLDLEMLVLTHGGRERTAAEFRTLLSSAGFEMTRVVSTGGSRSVIEARVGARSGTRDKG
jgi:hypothetical protein